MADEKRRIIYELLVEAKGGPKAKGELNDLGKGVQQLAARLGPLALGFAGVFALKGIGQAIGEMTKFNAQMATLGVTGAAATEALHGVQAVSVATGAAMTDVAKAYAEAVDMQQVLGRSTEAATRTTDAFVRIAMAEGKSAQDAARQIEMLAFAIDSGVLKSKEFITALKESNTFQQAAQEALGKTTAELAAMAKEGSLGAEQLTRIVLEMEKIGASKEATTTTDTLTQSFKNLFTTLSQGIGEAFDAGETKKIIDPDEISNAQKLTDQFRGAGKEIGGLLELALDGVKAVGREGKLLGKDLFGGQTAQQNWADYQAEVKQGMTEIATHWAQVKEGSVMGTWSDPNYGEEAKQRRKDARLRQDEIAISKGKAKDALTTMTSLWADIEKGEAASLARRAKAQEAAERARLQRVREAQAFYEETGRLIEASFKDSDAALRDKLENAVTDKDIQATLDEITYTNIPNFKRAVLDNFEQIDEAGAVLQDTFANLFSGGISNAREFFSAVLQGLSNVFAELAAAQAKEGFMDFLNLVLGSINFNSAQANANNFSRGGQNVSQLKYINAAKGRAFDGGHVLPFATGGVVNGPTVMRMANGGTGLMGEAGPEAVMPLRRTSGGKLGVSGSPSNITLVNNLGVKAKARVDQSSGDRMTLILEAANLGASIAEGRINRSINSGYGATAASMASSYRLRRNV